MSDPLFVIEGKFRSTVDLNRLVLYTWEKSTSISLDLRDVDKTDREILPKKYRVTIEEIDG